MWPKVTVWNIKQYENCCSFSIFKSNLKTKTNLKILLNNCTFFYFKIKPSDLHYCTVLIEVPPSPMKVISVHLVTYCWTSWRISSAMSTAKGKQQSWVTSRIISTVNWGPSLLNLSCKEWNQSNCILTYKYNMGFDSLIKTLSAYFAHFKIFTELN